MPRFNLDIALAAWRNSLKYNRIFLAEDLDELERHVRDHVAAAVKRGEDEETAFRQAIHEIGHFGIIESEYQKIFWEKRRHKNLLVSEFVWRIDMLKNYLTTAWRNVLRHKGYSFINVFGLSVGLAVFILITLFVRHELSYDRFHSRSNRIFRVAHFGERLYTSGALAPALMADIPEVERAIRISRRWPEVLVKRADETHFEGDFFFTDSTFFDVFDFPLISGNSETALKRPFSVIITEEIADKYFPGENPLGKTLSIKGLWDPGDFEITGVAANVPSNSHFQFSFLASFSTRYAYEENLESWNHYGDLTYVLVRADADTNAVKALMPEFWLKHNQPRDQNREVPDLTNAVGFQPITDIHLYSHLENELEVNAEPRYLYIFSVVALIVLLIACINYVNLSTARAARRAREVGVRKVAGANRQQLIYQFVSESSLLVLLSFVLAILLAGLSLPAFGALVDRTISFSQGGHEFWLLVVVVTLAVGLVCGLYPALYLSGFHPVQVLKGLVTRGSSNARFRSGSVIVQFTASVVLIAATLIIQSQLDFMQNKRLDMNPDQVIVLQTRNALGSVNYRSFRDDLLNHSEIRAVGGSYSLPPLQPETFMQLLPDRPAQGETPTIINTISAGPGYVDALDLEVVEGRDFLPDDLVRGRDNSAVLINEATVRALGWEDPIGMEFQCCFQPVPRVIGVIKDYHHQSVKEEITPLAILATWGSSYVFVRTSTTNLASTLDFIDEKYAAIAPGIPLELTFLDDEFSRAYQAELRLAQTFSVFSGLAVLIACLGLFGLASFTAQRRTREMGIRKVMGASVAGVVVLLSRDFVRLVIVAFVIGAPVAYFLMRDWLADFAYQTSVGPGIFIFSCLLVLAITVLSVSHQAIRAGLINPVESIRHE